MTAKTQWAGFESIPSRGFEKKIFAGFSFQKFLAGWDLAKARTLILRDPVLHSQPLIEISPSICPFPSCLFLTIFFSYFFLVSSLFPFKFLKNKLFILFIPSTTTKNFILIFKKSLNNNNKRVYI